MATTIWIGGASAVQQEWSLTPGGTIEADDIFNVILTNENGGTQTEAVVAGGTTVAAVTAAIASQCTSSSNSLFQALTWTDDTTHVTVTADVAGVPFYLSETTTETGGGAQDAQTFVAAEVTANAGPLDYNTAANWSTGSIPVADDIAAFGPNPTTGVVHDVRYGLNQSSIDLQRLRVSPEFKGGIIGDISNGYYLMIDVSNTTTSSAPSVVANGGHSVWLNGTLDRVYADGGTGGENAVRLKGSVANLYITSRFSGTIQCADGMVVGNVYNGYCPAVRLLVGSSVTSLSAGQIRWTAGYMRCKSAAGTYEISGGTVEQEMGATNAVHLMGGTMFYNSGGTLTDFQQWGGRMDLSRNHQAELIITDAVVFGGDFIESGGTPDVTYSNDLIQHGGRVDAQSNPTIVTSK